MNDEMLAKIAKEKEANKDNSATLRIIKYLEPYLEQNDAAAQKFMTEDKSFNKCMSKITANAKTESKGSNCCIDDEVVFGWAREYYGITTNAAITEVKQPVPKLKLDIDSLLD